MHAKHEFVIRAKCPMDNQPDTYEATLEVSRVVYVENILAALSSLEDKEIPQEELTVSLARKLGGRLTTVGYHSGIKTTVTAT